MLRNRYIADMKRRFSKVSRAIQQLVVVEDVFGLVRTMPFTIMIMQERQAFRFKADSNKVKAYRKWLQQQIDANILTVDAVSGKPWTATYAESAYRKGMLRSYIEVHKEVLAEDKVFYEGGKAQFLRDAFAAPVSLSKVELLYTRAFDELKGVTEVMGQQMSRILADGMVQGDGPAAIARNLRKNVVNITNTRAKVIARTEVIRAHAEGQLDAFERLGVEELDLMAEWSAAVTACEECAAYAADSPYKVDEAHGMIPLHPNCRCAWIPFLKKIHKKK